MSFDFATLLSPSYWLSIAPPSFSGPTLIVVFGVFTALFIAGIVVKIVGTQRTKDRYQTILARHVSRMLTTMGFLGVFLAFLSYENIRLLGGRFWYPVWLLALIIWVIWIVRFVKRELPAWRARDAERQTRDKYLPQSKK